MKLNYFLLLSLHGFETQRIDFLNTLPLHYMLLYVRRNYTPHVGAGVGVGDAMQYDAIRCDAMQCDSMRWNAMRCDAM